MAAFPEGLQVPGSGPRATRKSEPWNLYARLPKPEPQARQPEPRGFLQKRHSPDGCNQKRGTGELPRGRKRVGYKGSGERDMVLSFHL